MGENNGKEKTRKRKNDIFNYEKGLPIMVNLLVINSMYYGMSKADKFYEKNEPNKKKKAVPLFGEIFPISKQRFYHIRNGENFQITSNQADKIINIVGIDIKYFRKDDPIMLDISNEENLIDTVMWKYYFRYIYNVGYEFNVKYNEDKAKENVQRIDSALKHLNNRDWTDNSDKDDPLFRIWYYFSKGERYEPVSRVDKCINALREVDYKDWYSEGYAKMEEYRQLLKNHYDFINSLMVIHDLINQKR